MDKCTKESLILTSLVVLILIVVISTLALMSIWSASNNAKVDQVNLEKMGYEATYHKPFTGYESFCTVKVQMGEVPCKYVIGAKIID